MTVLWWVAVLPLWEMGPHLTAPLGTADPGLLAYVRLPVPNGASA